MEKSRDDGGLFGHFSKSVLSFVSVMLRACREVYFRFKILKLLRFPPPYCTVTSETRNRASCFLAVNEVEV